MRNLYSIILKESLIWYFLPAIFLTLYIGAYHAPFSSAIQHLYIITISATLCITIRIYCYKFTTKNIALALSTLLYSTVLYILVLYYSLVIIGLKSWGQVISKEIMISYASQAKYLSDTIGLSMLTLTLSLITGYILTTIFIFSVLKRHTIFVKIFTQDISPLLVGTLKVFLIILNISLFKTYIESPISAYTKEPIQLTLYSTKISDMHNKILEERLLKDRENKAKNTEDLIKKNYVTSKTAVKKNVIIFVVDALRPDHMGAYGYNRDTTPYLTELVKNKQLHPYDNVRASCNESACGISSMLSGRFVHQIHNNMFTMPQVLQRHGYEIHYILAGDHTNFYNLRKIYGNADSYFDGSMYKGKYMNDDTLTIDKTINLKNWNNKPVMLQFHLMSTHTLGRKFPQFKKFTPSKHYALVRNGKPKAEYINYYDNGVLQADSYINQILGLLKEKKYLNNAIVVITADHGESLGEHEVYAHGSSIREEQLRIPLLLMNFNKPLTIKNNNQFISQADIAPTILYDLNIPAPKNWQGKAIQEGLKHDFVHFQHKSDIGLYDLKDSNKIWKYWLNTNSKEEFAFNISLDRKEQMNLIQKIPVNTKTEWLTVTQSSIIQ